MSDPNDTAVPLPWDFRPTDPNSTAVGGIYPDFSGNYSTVPPSQLPAMQPHYAWNDRASAGLEGFQRWLLPNGIIEDNAVGWNRIFFGTVGSTNPRSGARNPTFDQALLKTGDDVSDFLDDVGDAIPDPLKDGLRNTLLLAGALGLGVLALK